MDTKSKRQLNEEQLEKLAKAKSKANEIGKKHYEIESLKSKMKNMKKKRKTRKRRRTRSGV